MKDLKTNDKIFYSIKFIIIGNQNVGKTNIIQRFTKGKFSNEYLITVGVDYLSHNIKIENKIFHLQIWDTAGSEKFKSITKSYFSNSACALIVYDITNEYSFNSVKQWIEECQNYTNKNIVLILIGNKNDLKEERKISEEQGKSLAESYGMEFYESSALTGNNINEIFFNACKTINNNINKDLYDLEELSNGIKICKMDNNMNIDKEIKNQKLSIKLENKKHLKKKKCNC